MGNSLESYCCAIGTFANNHPPKTTHMRVVGARQKRERSTSPLLLVSILTIVIIQLLISGIEKNPRPVILKIDKENLPCASADTIAVVTSLV